MEKSNSNIVNRNTSNFCRQPNNKSKKIINNIRDRVAKNNLVTPEIFLSEIWMREDTKSGVEITEINSSDSETEEPLEEPTSQEQAKDYGHAWSYINNRLADDSEYKINNRAREKWRKDHKELASVNEYLHSHDTQTNFNGFHYIEDSQVSGMQQTPHANCFTIINNHVINSESSIASDQEYGMEEIESFYVDNSNNPQNTYWDHVYKDDSDSYSPRNPDKRTVWIYSFKNQRLLSENDFELVNIPSGDSAGTSTSNTLTDEEEHAEKGTNVNRISSPIPSAYMPRLDLCMAQTLSTVTELSELKSNESLVKIPINNWLAARDIAKTKKEVPDVVNWMSLSPRERRRRFKNTAIDVTPDSPIKNEYTYAEGNIPNKAAIIRVDADVHATDDVFTKRTTDLDVCSIQSGDFVPQVKDMETNENSVNVSYDDADPEIDADNIHREFNECVKPSIDLTTNKTYNVITDPIEKLNTDYWIGDVVKEEPSTPYDSLVEPNEPRSVRPEIKDIESCMNDDVSNTVSRKLWLKRTKLMKSPLWDQYLPITGTPLSLNLSMSLSSIESKKCWFRCIGKYLKCCR